MRVGAVDGRASQDERDELGALVLYARGAGPDLAENGPDRRASAGRVGSAGRTADRGTSVTPGTDTNGSVR